MAYNLHVIRTDDFVRLDGRGKPDLIESRRALEHVARSCIERGTNAVLLDVRKMQSHLEPGDLYNLVCSFHAMGFRDRHRVAVLHRYSDGSNADFFALCAATSGWHVRSFIEFEEAMEWFGTEIPVA